MNRCGWPRFLQEPEGEDDEHRKDQIEGQLSDRPGAGSDRGTAQEATLTHDTSLLYSIPID